MHGMIRHTRDDGSELLQLRDPTFISSSSESNPTAWQLVSVD